MTINFNDKIINGLYYGAIGDALGYQVEFTSHKNMPSKIPLDNTLIISDDTQMSLALGRAINNWIPGKDENSVACFWYNIVDEFLDWYVDPDNNRAPGDTCLGSMRSINENLDEVQLEKIVFDSSRTSTGSGAVMRVFPVMAVPAEYRYALAWAQAITTHADPRSVVAAMTVVNAVETIITTGSYSLNDTKEFLHQLSTPETFVTLNIPSGAWMKSLALASTGGTDDEIRTLGAYLEGMNEVDRNGLTLHSVIDNGIAYLDGVDADTALDPSLDVQDIIGAGGWDSVSAVGIFLLGLDLATNKGLPPCSVMNWLIRTSGDSDTVASVFGQLYGFYGRDDLLDSLIDRIEPRYLEEINALI